MKKLHLTLHYIVFTLIITVVIFFIYYMYDKFKIKEKPQYVVQKHNVFHDEILKITKEATEEKKPKIEKTVKPKVEKIVKPKVEKIVKPPIQKIYDAKMLYIQNCKLCHGTIKTFTKKVTKNRLNKVFSQNAKELSLIHEKSNVSKITNKYFKSKEYELQIESIIKYITKQ